MNKDNYVFCQDLFEDALKHYVDLFYKQKQLNKESEFDKIKYDLLYVFYKNYRIEALHDFTSTESLILEIQNYKSKECDLTNTHHYISVKVILEQLLLKELLKANKNEFTKAS